jgi:putative SOS response-associated peptidase YedK
MPQLRRSDKPAFRILSRSKGVWCPRAVYYENSRQSAKKQPYKIGLRNGALFAFAGLWARWAPETGEPVETFAIITTQANKLVSDVHQQMPVIIAPADYHRWLSASDQTAKRLLVPYISGMAIAPVSDRVNNIKDDDVGLIAPL